MSNYGDQISQIVVAVVKEESASKEQGHLEFLQNQMSKV